MLKTKLQQSKKKKQYKLNSLTKNKASQYSGDHLLSSKSFLLRIFFVEEMSEDEKLVRVREKEADLAQEVIKEYDETKK